MSNKQSPQSRSNRFEKKRRSTKWLTWLVGAGSVFMVLFISLWFFGDDEQTGKAQETKEVEAEDHQETEGNQDKESDSDSADEKEKNATEEQEEQSEKHQVSIENFEELKPIEDEEGLKIEKSENPNVERVITKDWPVIPTEMETNAEHSITYQPGSQDYKELQQAIRSAVGLSENNIIYWRVENRGGPQKAISVVSDKNKTGYLRVHVDWIDGQGYKPVKLEVLNEFNG
jgi:cytoskeletal protein RodZ